ENSYEHAAQASAAANTGSRCVLNSGRSTPALLDLLQGRAFVDCYVIGLVALDDVLRLFFGSMPFVTFEDHLRSDFLLDGSANAACFRVPFDMISPFEISRHGIPPPRT